MTARPAAVGFAIALAAALPRGGEAGAAAKVDLKTARYADLVRAVKAARGKVVVVDIWSLY
jgi:hypothetical protein